jgi:hypothetical protein
MCSSQGTHRASFGSLFVNIDGKNAASIKRKDFGRETAMILVGG